MIGYGILRVGRHQEEEAPVREAQGQFCNVAVTELVRHIGAFVQEIPRVIHTAAFVGRDREEDRVLAEHDHVVPACGKRKLRKAAVGQGQPQGRRAVAEQQIVSHAGDGAR